MITSELFNRIFPTRNLNPRKFNLVRQRDELIAALNKYLPLYGIDTYLRVCAFLSCCGVETDYFRTSAEYASGEDYEGRRDLGNVQPGDGRRFRGGSLIQTTGRYNYFRVLIRFVKKLTGKDYSKEPFTALAEADRLGVNFIKHPELLRNNIEIAVEAACIFWEENNLNEFADRKQIKQLNAVVNRGDKNKTPLQWDKRNLLYSVFVRKVPVDFCFSPVADIPVSPVPVIEPPPSGTSPTGGDVVGQSEVSTGDDGQLNLDMDSARQRINDGIDVVKRPGVKSVIKVILYKACGYFLTVWELGLSAQIALILGGILILTTVGFVIWHYRREIKAGCRKIKNAVLNSLKTKNEN